MNPSKVCALLVGLGVVVSSVGQSVTRPPSGPEVEILDKLRIDKLWTELAQRDIAMDVLKSAKNSRSKDVVEGLVARIDFAPYGTTDWRIRSTEQVFPVVGVLIEMGPIVAPALIGVLKKHNPEATSLLETALSENLRLPAPWLESVFT